ncbi:DNA-directed RNA polymerase subunit beta [Priestia endophytica]|jgi:hypothetical protein|nr:DNA-directed RNA polymerase subunit beta [Priestia endophytica]MCM3540296.1 DNA-directed RNA polymerase subunit beta [Priestia endophytica]
MRQTMTAPTSEVRHQHKKKEGFLKAAWNDLQQARKNRVKLFPLWLRVMIVSVLMTVSALIGVVVGYAFIGDGSVFDALKPSTWNHIMEFIVKE